MKLQVFIHGIDVIKDVMCNSWNDSHELRVVQLSLWTQKPTVTWKALLGHKRGENLVHTHTFIQWVPLAAALGGFA